MSMNQYYVHVSPQLLERIREKPDAVDAVVSPLIRSPVEKVQEDPPVLMPTPLAHSYLAMPNMGKRQFLGVFKKETEKLNRASELLEPGMKKELLQTQLLSIEKAWHGIHFVLNGYPEKGQPPLYNAVLGGSEVGRDLGYGPARFLTPEEVKQTAGALNAVSEEEFKKRFDFEKIKEAEIYAVMDDEPEDALDYLLHYYKQLVDYFNEASEKERGMVMYCL